MFRRRRATAGLVAAVLAAGVIIALVFAAGKGSNGNNATSGSTTTVQHGNRHAPHIKQAVAHLALCPLTGARPTHGKVPDRPAVAVKIGNEPYGARPQSGLNEADIVYDTPAEGFIQRYMAVYQCSQASSIGPTRSVRWVDWQILSAFTGRPILAYAGGIIPDTSVVQGLPYLRSADLLGAQYSAGIRITSRVPPDNLYTSTEALLKLFPGAGPPKPVFRYSSSFSPLAKPVSTLAINFSPGTDAGWTWSPAKKLFLHSYSGSPDIDALTGQQVSTTNIFVQVVKFHYGPYQESPGGTGDVESQVIGSGKGWILRGGREVPVTWHRPTASSMTTFTDAAGHAVALAPGRTWVEIVLDIVANQPGAITFTP